MKLRVILRELLEQEEPPIGKFLFHQGLVCGIGVGIRGGGGGGSGGSSPPPPPCDSCYKLGLEPPP